MISLLKLPRELDVFVFFHFFVNKKFREFTEKPLMKFQKVLLLLNLAERDIPKFQKEFLVETLEEFQEVIFLDEFTDSFYDAFPQLLAEIVGGIFNCSAAMNTGKT